MLSFVYKIKKKGGVNIAVLGMTPMLGASGPSIYYYVEYDWSGINCIFTVTPYTISSAGLLGTGSSMTLSMKIGSAAATVNSSFKTSSTPWEGNKGSMSYGGTTYYKMYNGTSITCATTGSGSQTLTLTTTRTDGIGTSGQGTATFSITVPVAATFTTPSSLTHTYNQSGVFGGYYNGAGVFVGGYSGKIIYLSNDTNTWWKHVANGSGIINISSDTTSTGNRTLYITLASADIGSGIVISTSNYRSISIPRFAFEYYYNGNIYQASGSTGSFSLSYAGAIYSGLTSNSSTTSPTYTSTSWTSVGPSVNGSRWYVISYNNATSGTVYYYRGSGTQYSTVYNKSILYYYGSNSSTGGTLTCNEPTRTCIPDGNYSFQGWARTNATTSAYYSTLLEAVQAGYTVLYGVYYLAAPIFTMYYYRGTSARYSVNTTGGTAGYYYGTGYWIEPVTGSISEPTKTCLAHSSYLFQGWTSNSDSISWDQTTLNGMRLLGYSYSYGIYLLNESITYYPQNGSSFSSLTRQRYYYGTGSSYHINPIEPSIFYLGYTLQGWSTTPDGIPVSWTDALGSENRTVYAIWKIDNNTPEDPYVIYPPLSTLTYNTTVPIGVEVGVDTDTYSQTYVISVVGADGEISSESLNYTDKTRLIVARAPESPVTIYQTDSLGGVSPKNRKISFTFAETPWKIASKETPAIIKTIASVHDYIRVVSALNVLASYYNYPSRFNNLYTVPTQGDIMKISDINNLISFYNEILSYSYTILSLIPANASQVAINKIVSAANLNEFESHIKAMADIPIDTKVI